MKKLSLASFSWVGWMAALSAVGCSGSGTAAPNDNGSPTEAGGGSPTIPQDGVGSTPGNGSGGASGSSSGANGSSSGSSAANPPTGATGAGGMPGTGSQGTASVDAGATANPAADSAAPSSGGDASARGGPPPARDAGMTTGGDAAGGVVAPPVTDPTSTLGISAPGAGYHVEGNIIYGPSPMQRLDVIYPTNAGPNGTTTLPGVIMFHGGGWIDNKPQAIKASMSSFFSRFLKHGFLVCNVEYRLADGTANGAIAPAAVQDALTAAKWFWDHMDHYHVDKTKYVSTGGSAGGHLAMMVGLATDPALGPTSPKDFKIAAVVNGYGPADVTDLLAKNVSFAVQWLPQNTPNRAALAVQVSPITYARKDAPPLITVQGDMDHTVPMSESQALFNALTAAGATTALHFVVGAGHGFSTPASAWPDAEATMFAFLTANGI